MIDTQEVGAGSYPSAPEDTEYKCYRFKALITEEIEGYIYIKKDEDVREMIQCKKWEEIDSSRVIEVEEIVEVKEVKE